MLKHTVLLYFDLVFYNAFSSGIFLAVKLVYLQSPYPNGLVSVQTSASPHSCGVCSFKSLLQSVKGFVNHTHAFLPNGWSSVPMTCLSISFPCGARRRRMSLAGCSRPPLTLCLLAVFLALRGVLHPAVPAAQLPGGLPGPGNSSTPGGGMESE